MRLWVQMDGKSTLANILSGKTGYEITGELKYQGKDLNDIPIEERAQKGIFSIPISVRNSRC